MQNSQNAAITVALPGCTGVAKIVNDPRGTLVWFSMANGSVIVGCPCSPDMMAMLLRLPEDVIAFMPMSLAPEGFAILGFEKARIDEMSAQIFDDFFPAVGGQV